MVLKNIKYKNNRMNKAIQSRYYNIIKEHVSADNKLVSSDIINNCYASIKKLEIKDINTLQNNKIAMKIIKQIINERLEYEHLSTKEKHSFQLVGYIASYTIIDSMLTSISDNYSK